MRRWQLWRQNIRRTWAAWELLILLWKSAVSKSSVSDVPLRWRSYRAGVVHGLDEGVVVVRHFFVVGAEEAQRFVVAVCFSVEPGDGLVADVGEVLSCCRTQQLEERHLDAGDGTLLYIHIRELWKTRTWERSWWERSAKEELMREISWEGADAGVQSRKESRNRTGRC